MSQICILMLVPSTLIFFVANSTPMVGLLSAVKASFKNLLSMVLLPTEVSPTSIYLSM